MSQADVIINHFNSNKKFNIYINNLTHLARMNQIGLIKTLN